MEKRLCPGEEDIEAQKLYSSRSVSAVSVGNESARVGEFGKMGGIGKRLGGAARRQEG